MSPRAWLVVYWAIALGLILTLLHSVSAILLPFVVGFAIAYVLDPVADQFERLKCSRGLATTIALTLFFLAILLVFLLLVPVLQGQVSDFIRRLPNLVTAARQNAEQLLQFAQERLSPEDMAKLREAASGKLSSVLAWGATALQSILTSGIAIANLLSLIFITPIVAFFLLRDWDRMVARIDSWLPRNYADVLREQARQVDLTLAGFLRGQLTVCVVMGVYYAIALTVVGLDFGLVIGLLIGIFVFVPYVGAAAGGALAIGLAAAQFQHWWQVAVVAGIFGFGQLVESNVLGPKLVGERVNLHPVWLMFALLAFGKLFGFVGVLIAVPLAAVIGVAVRFSIQQYLQSSLYDPANIRE